MPLTNDPIIAQSSSTYFPVLLGATDNPTVVYARQVGTYRMYGKRCIFDIDIITSSITKTTLTDGIRVSLPAQAAPNPAMTRITSVQCENTTPVKVGAAAYISSGNSYMDIQQNTGGLLTVLTYGAVNGIGILSNQITIRVGGSYETA